MANKKISDLGAAGAITGAELVELVQGGLSVRSTVNNITVSASYAMTASLLGGMPNTFFNKSDWTIPAFVTTNSQSMLVNTNLLIYINNQPYSFASGSTITMPATMLAGNDYGIYAITNGGLVATYANTSSIALGGYTPPPGYNTTNSRLIGGFYFAHSGSSPLSVIGRSCSTTSASLSMSISNTGLVTGDYIDVILMTDYTYNTINIPVTASNATLTFPLFHSIESYTADTAGKVYKINNNGIINQYSIWDLKFRPDCPDPRGMVLVDKSFWTDIWLTGTQYLTNGTSRKGQRIADGENSTSYPLISTNMGGNGSSNYGDCTWFSANEVVSHWGKKLLSYTDFCIAAFNGVTENGSYGTDNQYTCRPPGNQYISKWGMEQSYGIMNIWGSDLNFYLNASSTSTLTIINSISRSKSSGVAAITSSTGHNLQVGDVITTTLFGSGSTSIGTYNRISTIVQSVPSTSSFTFNASGSDESTIVDTAGRISTGLAVATVTLPTYNYQAQTSGRGYIYTTSDGLIAGLYGGSWSNGAVAGSRYSGWYICVWYIASSFGLRGRSDHLVVP